jgi:hypothetical protein
LGSLLDATIHQKHQREPMVRVFVQMLPALPECCSGGPRGQLHSWVLPLKHWDRTTHTQTHLGRQVKVEDQPEHHKLLIPNSESIGFQSLGSGTGDTKMHAPKNRNSPGTLLEPFAVGLQSWANCGLC